MNDDRRVQRWTERLAWNVNLWIDTLERRLDMLDLMADNLLRRFGDDDDDDGDGSAHPPREQQEPPPTAISSSSSSQVEASSSRPHESDASGDEREGCRSEVCRYFHAMDRLLFWGSFEFFISIAFFVTMNVMILTDDNLNTPETRRISGCLFGCLAIQMISIFIFMDTLAPAVECRRVCSKLHLMLKSIQHLRKNRPGLYCTFLCSMTFSFYLIGRFGLNLSPCCYWSFTIGPLILRLLQVLIGKTSKYFNSRKEWQCDSEIDDEFLPLVTEANLQVLNRVGETGDHSPTPTSILSDCQNESFNDEDYIEGLYDIAPSMPSHEEGSTDGVELSELELSVGENDAEEDDIKFQTGHFKKSSSSSSSSEEGAFDRKIITVSSDESNDSDYEIIDKEEIEDKKMC